MSIKRETIAGTKIINEVNSTNLSKTEYDVETRKLIAEFKNGTRYEYENVPHNLYTQFRMAESQGKFFMSKIARAFKYKKI